MEDTNNNFVGSYIDVITLRANSTNFGTGIYLVHRVNHIATIIFITYDVSINTVGEATDTESGCKALTLDPTTRGYNLKRLNTCYFKLLARLKGRQSYIWGEWY